MKTERSEKKKKENESGRGPRVNLRGSGSKKKIYDEKRIRRGLNKR